MNETYLYDETGQRIRKTSSGVSTFYPFAGYEQKSGGGTTITKYYFFGGMLLAKSEGGVLTYLHSDHLGSVVLETNAAGAVVNDQRYYAYGRRLDVSGDTSGEKDFTGQRRDATGLVYMNCILPLQHRHRVPKASGACRNSVSVLDRTCQSKSMGPAQASPMPASALYLLIAGR